MFDFPKNSIDYLHRTGRTARMGAKGKVTSLVAKKNLQLATRIEEAIKKNESLESLTTDKVHRDIARSQITQQKGKTRKLIKQSNQSNKIKASTVKSSSNHTKASAPVKSSNGRIKSASSVDKSGKKASSLPKSAKSFTFTKKVKVSSKSSADSNKDTRSKRSSAAKSTKLSVVPLRSRSSSSSFRHS